MMITSAYMKEPFQDHPEERYGFCINDGDTDSML